MSFIRVNEESLGFVMLIAQKKQSEATTLGSRNCEEQFSKLFDI